MSSRLERQRIATLRANGTRIREIARRIGRAASTVSRELRRNLLRHDRDIYDADLAHARARERARRIRRTRLIRDPELRALVQSKLELEWNPEQIAAHLRAAHPDRPLWHLCHETIYQGFYHGGKRGLSRELTRRLRTGRPLRKRRRRAHERQTRFVAPAVLIDQRPVAVEDRGRIGDWEGDLIVGRMSRSAIGTLVERSSRYMRLIHLSHGHSAEQLRIAMIAAPASLAPTSRLTLAWDQGSEMAQHPLLVEQLRDRRRPSR